MFIHLGGEKVIRSSELIGIFDLSIERSSKISKHFVQQASLENRIEIIGEEESKSLVVTRSRVYYSPISSSTLKKRAESISHQLQ
ncbi:extracellular matrix regulator RemB [Paenibacillus thermoaerophilus]|uniref:Extracellular matrix regulator RemB n=1 Tax=Paenibacillus thermoaerophilus TaxID=1215385 RepID=A0ABW2V287_9BACL|nr:extracellular matrix/biofilm biosynthesis regulator RemA family protein [Paenibacillus thermoaerophilus]TMV06673.1 DUF370 domain-containing protein [Paenibacillus thermoaerophilus]